MRALVITLAALAAGCGTKPCKDGTLFVTVELEGEAASADALSSEVAIAGGAPTLGTVAHTPGERSGGLEVTFPAGYPTGQPVRVRLTATAGGKPIAAGEGALPTAKAGCDVLSLTINGAVDGGADLPGQSCAMAPACTKRHTVCDDSSGTARCVCVAGYAPAANGDCVWQTAPADSEFQGMPAGAWTTEGGAVIEPAAVGVDAPGNLHFNKAAICTGATSAKQTISVPTFAEAEPLALQVVSQQDCVAGGMPCAAVGGVSVLLNGGAHLFEPTPTLVKKRICLGERAYGGPLAIAAQPANREPCALPSLTAYDVRVDQLSLVPDGTCPAPATLVNGNFEGGMMGWVGKATGVGASAGIVAGAGAGGSMGGRITAASQCQNPQLIGNASFPMTSLTHPAVQLYFQGTATKDAYLGEDPSRPVWARLTASVGAQQLKVCVPEYAKGQALPLTFSAPPTGGACMNPDARQFELDDVQFVEEPTCPAQAYLVDGGFERVTPTATTWVPSINTNNTVGMVSAAFPADAAQAHGGTRALRLSVSQNCTSAAATTVLTVPPSAPGAGPALKFFYRANVSTNVAFTVSTGLIQGMPLPASATYVARTVCLDPTRVGQGIPLRVAAAATGGTCATTFTAEVAQFDDFTVTTDPTCPTK